MNDWYGKRYHSLNAFFKNKFGEKVYRVSLDAGFTCPNRDGTKGTEGCIYCGEEGARASYVNPAKSVREQLIDGMEIIKRRYKAEKFIAYFQAYTNTYAPADKLKSIYNKALSSPEVIGISVGTRPDCIDEEKINMLESITEKKLVIIEYGIQSMKAETLKLINRGHTVENSVNSIRLTKNKKGIYVLAHVILGLPGEDFSDMENTVKALVNLCVDAFKFHHLYIEKGTFLESMYRNKTLKLLSLEEYTDILCRLLPIIPENIVIHRLFGQCSKENLIAPLWTLNKAKNIALLDRLLKEKNIMQGMSFQELYSNG